jgi:hypothetical protein
VSEWLRDRDGGWVR